MINHNCFQILNYLVWTMVTVTFEQLCKLWVKWLPNKIRGWKTLLICAGLRLLSDRTIWPCTYCWVCSDNGLSTASGKIGRGERFIRAADALMATYSCVWTAQKLSVDQSHSLSSQCQSLVTQRLSVIWADFYDFFIDFLSRRL